LSWFDGAADQQLSWSGRLQRMRESVFGYAAKSGSGLGPQRMRCGSLLLGSQYSLISRYLDLAANHARCSPKSPRGLCALCRPLDVYHEPRLGQLACLTGGAHKMIQACLPLLELSG